MPGLFHLPCLLLTMLHTALAAPPSASAYGKASLTGLKKYGVAVQVACNGTLEQHRETLKTHIEDRLRARKVPVVPLGSATLKLLVTSIASEEGFLVVHMALELDQSAWLPSSGKMVDAPTWDAWKMAESREENLLEEVDDLVGLFLNDYLAVN